MTKKLKFIGAALLALAILPAAIFLIHVHPATLLGLGLGIAGTVTVTYQTFEVTGTGGGQQGGGYTGGTVPPTASQATAQNGVNAVVALVNYADTDTLITITHNMQITAAALAALMPYITVYWQALAASTNTYPLLTFALTNSNVVTINKFSNVGTAGTMVVEVRRPGTVS
jgi:hypothetical protein